MITYVDKIFAFISIFLVTLLGAVVPLFISSYSHSKAFNLALGFSGGILLSGGLVHLLPEAIEDLNRIKEHEHLDFKFPLCEICVVLGIYLIICVEQIIDFLIQKKKVGCTPEETEILDSDKCCNKCYNIFIYANKFDYLNFPKLIKHNEIEENRMYFVNLKKNEKIYNDDICLNKVENNNSSSLGLRSNNYIICEEDSEQKLKRSDSTEINLKYQHLSLNQNKDMLISKLNHETFIGSEEHILPIHYNSSFTNDNINGHGTKSLEGSSPVHNIHSKKEATDRNFYQMKQMELPMYQYAHEDKQFEKCDNDVICFVASLSGTPTEEETINNSTLNDKFNKTPIILLLAFSVHSIIEGITLGSVHNSFFASLSIIFHKGFASFSLGVNLLRKNTILKEYMLFMLFFSLMTPFGIILGLITNIFASSSVTVLKLLPSILTSVGAGTFIYISLFEIIGPLLYTYKIHNHCLHSKKNYHLYKIQHKIQIIVMIIIGSLIMLLITCFF